MQQLSPELLQAGDIWPIPRVQRTGSGDEHIAFIGVLRVLNQVSNLSSVILIAARRSMGRFAYLQRPFGFLVVPDSAGDLLAEFDVFHAVVLSGNLLPVRMDLLR